MSTNIEFLVSAAERDLAPLNDSINQLYLSDETECVEAILKLATLNAASGARVQAQAAQLVHSVRANRKKAGGLDAFFAKSKDAELSIGALKVKKEIAKATAVVAA